MEEMRYVVCKSFKGYTVPQAAFKTIFDAEEYANSIRGTIYKTRR